MNRNSKIKNKQRNGFHKGAKLKRRQDMKLKERIYGAN